MTAKERVVIKRAQTHILLVRLSLKASGQKKSLTFSDLHQLRSTMQTVLGQNIFDKGALHKLLFFFFLVSLCIFFRQTLNV